MKQSQRAFMLRIPVRLVGYACHCQSPALLMASRMYSETCKNNTSADAGLPIESKPAEPYSISFLFLPLPPLIKQGLKEIFIFLSYNNFY